eukprot:343713-Pelagomonas_calceolata.AAC.2
MTCCALCIYVIKHTAVKVLQSASRACVCASLENGIVQEVCVEQNGCRVPAAEACVHVYMLHDKGACCHAVAMLWCCEGKSACVHARTIEMHGSVLSDIGAGGGTQVHALSCNTRVHAVML